MGILPLLIPSNPSLFHSKKKKKSQTRSIKPLPSLSLYFPFIPLHSPPSKHSIKEWRGFLNVCGGKTKKEKIKGGKEKIVST
jgi:hypothetical protein